MVSSSETPTRWPAVAKRWSRPLNYRGEVCRALSGPGRGGAQQPKIRDIPAAVRPPLPYSHISFPHIDSGAADLRKPDRLVDTLPAEGANAIRIDQQLQTDGPLRDAAPMTTTSPDDLPRNSFMPPEPSRVLRGVTPVCST